MSLPGIEFIKSVLDQATLLFKFALLPELLGTYYSRLPMATRAFCESEQSFGEQDRDESSKSEELNLIIHHKMRTRMCGVLVVQKNLVK